VILRLKTDVRYICKEKISLISHGNNTTPLSRCSPEYYKFKEGISRSILCNLDIKVVHLKLLGVPPTVTIIFPAFCPAWGYMCFLLF